MDATKQMKLNLPVIFGVLIGVFVSCSGDWFTYDPPGADYSERVAWNKAALGTRNNLLILIVFPAIGAALGSWFGWMICKSRSTTSQRRTGWLVFSVVVLVWLGLVLLDAGHDIEYPAFALSLALCLRVFTMVCRRSTTPLPVSPV